MNTIDEVLQRMDEIVEECRENSSVLGYFAVLYRKVTQRIKFGIENEEFENSQRMELLDILFARRFFDAYDIYRKNSIPTQSWHVAFLAAEKNTLLVLHHLLLGINAHINLDLGIAAVETMKGKPLAGIKKDFDRINNILAELVEGVKTNISRISPVFGLVIRLANKKDEMLVNFSINIARKGAWEFAQRYAASSDKSLSLNLRDGAIAGIAHRLAYPGRRMRWIIALIRIGEISSVPRAMEKLDSVAVTGQVAG